jgi:hypothetical protein
MSNPQNSLKKKMKMRGPISLIIFTMLNMASTAQPDHRHSLGLGVGAVYLSDDKAVSPGLQLEYAYHFVWGTTPLHASACTELIFGDERHIGLALGLGFTPIGNLDLGMGPGVMFEGEKQLLCLHLSGSWGFNLRGISMGPAVELAHTGKHFHMLAGLIFEIDF